MALSDCPACWDTPCTCGYGYTHLNYERLANHLANITQYRSKEDAVVALERAILLVKANTNWRGKPDGTDREKTRDFS